jgi:hypothetical protein
MSRVAGGPVLPIAECFAEMTRICGVANRSANLVSSRRRVVAFAIRVSSCLLLSNSSVALGIVSIL